MNFKQIFKQYWLISLSIMVLFFWLGFFITEKVMENDNTNYSILIDSNVIEVEDIDVDFFLDALRKVDEEGNVSYSYATVKPESFFANNDIEVTEKDNKILISIKATYFIGKNEEGISAASEERFIKVMEKVIGFYDQESRLYTIEFLAFIVGVFSLVAGFFIFWILMYVFRNKLPIIDDEIYENGDIFKWPISKEYWKLSINSVKNIKIFDMCLIAILFALQILMKFVAIPSGFANLGIGLTYLIFAYICLIYGPVWGLIIGFSSDIIGFIMKPTIFHPGYTLQAMLSGFAYGVCLYRTDLKFSKVLMCRMIINILLNGIFGAFLWGSYAELSFDATIVYMFAVCLPKNILYLIPQTLLLYFFLRASVPLVIRKGLVPKNVLLKKDNEPNINW